MKKIALILIILSILAFPAFSDALWDTPGEFTIKGYKLERVEEPNIAIYDALTGSLERIIQDEELVVDGYYTLGDSTSSIVNDIAFSYLVTGNSEFNGTVTITLNPFHRTNGEVEEVIKTTYVLMNETVRFLDSNTSTSKDQAAYGGSDNTPVTTTDYLTITDTDTDDTVKRIELSTADLSLEIGTEGRSLTDSFSISDGRNDDNTSTVSDVWMARGAVGFIIDSSTFNSASYGQYKAEVIVKLEGK